jgi:CysZ protein
MTEVIVLGREAPAGSIRGTLKSAGMAFADALYSLAFLVAVNVPVLMVSVLVPFVGTALGAALSFGFSALLLAQEFVTMPLARQLVAYRKRFAQVWRNRWLAFGFGLAAMGLLLVPGLNLLLLPLAACGGTLAYCDLERAGRVDPPVKSTAGQWAAGQ